MGIAPAYLQNINVLYSFNLLKEDDININQHEIIHGLTSRSFSWYMSVDYDGKFYITWRTIYVICCLVSSYLYGYMACFRGEDDHVDKDIHGDTVIGIEPLKNNLY